MSCPFPGMDPFLEEAAGWPGFHTRLVAAVSDALAAEVMPRYHVQIEERVYVTDPDADPGFSSFVPDAFISRSPAETSPRSSPGVHVTNPVLIADFLDDEIHDRYLEIRDAHSREVVSAIEILSPANKVNGSRGREALDTKRRQILAAGANWMEIDLLRGGTRSPRVAGRTDYCVLLLRPGRRGALAWLFRLRDPLPVVSVPLRPPHEDVALDLPAILSGCYERARYAEALDYTGPVPLPPLGSADADWVRERIGAWRTERGVAGGSPG